jgi:hypothetical protein
VPTSQPSAAVRAESGNSRTTAVTSASAPRAWLQMILLSNRHGVSAADQYALAPAACQAIFEDPAGRSGDTLRNEHEQFTFLGEL